MKKLILIRHCETDYILQGRYCGHENIPLNAKGIEQANSLRSKLKGIKVDRIYSSDLKRAFQTAKIVFQNKIIYKRKALREIDFGVFSGLTFKEASSLYPVVYRTWLNAPVNTKIPEGERFRDFAKRIEGCFDKIFNQNAKKTVALVSHGGPIRIILLNILKQEFDKLWNIELPTASINVIAFRKGEPTATWEDLFS